MTRLTPEREAEIRHLMRATAWAAEPGRNRSSTAETHEDLRDLLSEIDALREERKPCETCRFWESPYTAADGKRYGFCSGLADMILGHDVEGNIVTEPTFGCARHAPRELT